MLGTTNGPTDIQYVSICNTTAVAEAFVIKHNDGTTNVQLFDNITLPAFWTLTYEEGCGWRLFDVNGNLQVISAQPGRYIKTTVILTGTTTFTTGSSTNSVRFRIVGSGGSGGGCTSVASAAAAGGGGGGAGYCEGDGIAVTPSTAYTCAVGASVNGSSGAAGTVGNVSTLAISGTTYTANGGTAGVVGTATTTVTVTAAVAGGTASNGTLNLQGEQGHGGAITLVATPIGFSGAGGCSPLGVGGKMTIAVGAGSAAPVGGFGGGGAGALTGASAVQTGGASTAGVIVIDEFT